MTSTNWYWRDGTVAVNAELGSEKWEKQTAKLEEKLKDGEYKIVKQETLPDGKWISTVWLGLDYSWDSGTPLIFETMVFPEKGNFSELDVERYSTEKEALKGHKKMVKKWRVERGDRGKMMIPKRKVKSWWRRGLRKVLPKWISVLAQAIAFILLFGTVLLLIVTLSI